MSVFVAFFIGTMELLGVLSQEAALNGGFWSFMGNFNINTVGFVTVGLLRQWPPPRLLLCYSVASRLRLVALPSLLL